MPFISDAFAQAAPQAQQGGMSSLVMIAIMFALMYFMLMRPQQKRAKEHQTLINSLKKGDEVMTNSGLMGKIIALDEYAIDLEIARNTVVRIQRPYVAAILPKGSLKAELKEEKVEKVEKVEKQEKTAINTEEPANDVPTEEKQ